MQADARPKRKRSGDATANRVREQKRRDLLKAKRTAQLKKLMAVVLCVTTECTPGTKTAKALVVEKATLFLVVERLEQGLAKSGGGGGLKVGVSKLVTRAATEACLLGDTRRWLDPLTEMGVAKRQLQTAAKEVAAWGGRMGSGQLELTTVVSRRRKMLAPKNRNATLERQPAAVGGEADGTGRRGTGGNAAGDAEGAGGVRQKRGARHSKAHFKQVSRDWLAQTAKSRYRSGSRFRVSKEQAEQLHRWFWQFCSYQRRVRRLQREINAAGGVAERATKHRRQRAGAEGSRLQRPADPQCGGRRHPDARAAEGQAVLGTGLGRSGGLQSSSGGDAVLHALAQVGRWQEAQSDLSCVRVPVHGGPVGPCATVDGRQIPSGVCMCCAASFATWRCILPARRSLTSAPLAGRSGGGGLRVEPPIRAHLCRHQKSG
jgi:hypothetical protein